jgi:hypothetical protein
MAKCSTGDGAPVTGRNCAGTTVSTIAVASSAQAIKRMIFRGYTSGSRFSRLCEPGRFTGGETTNTVRIALPASGRDKSWALLPGLRAQSRRFSRIRRIQCVRRAHCCARALFRDGLARGNRSFWGYPVWAPTRPNAAARLPDQQIAEMFPK